MSEDRGAATAPHFSPHTGRVEAAAILVTVGSLGGRRRLDHRRRRVRGSDPTLAAGAEPAPSEVARVRLRQAFLAGQAATRAAADTWSHDGGRQEADSRP